MKPYLFKKDKGRGKHAYYLGMNEKIDGRSKRVWEMYIDTAETIYEFLESGGVSGNVRTVSFGAVAALLAIASELDLAGVIDRHVPGTDRQDVTAGTCLLVCALNRCMDPVSKNKLERWYDRTFLPGYFKIDGEKFSSQNVWNKMNKVGDAEIAGIESELCEKIVQEYNIGLDSLLYDATNFHTFIEEHGDNVLPQHGHSKSKRFDLRQVNVALLVTRDFGVPLFHSTYEGNMPDSKKFRVVLPALVERIKAVTKGLGDVTLIFDKGNNSSPNLEQVEETGLHFAGSLRPSLDACKELMAIPLEEYSPVYQTNKGTTVLAWRTAMEVYGVTRTVIVTHDATTRVRQFKRLWEELDARFRELQELRGRLNWKKWRDAGACDKKAREIVNKRRTKKLVGYRLVKHDGTGKITLRYWVNWEEYARKVQRHGKSVLFTDCMDWDTVEIIRAYRSQHVIEQKFRDMKDPSMMRIMPMYHWTDQKIKVHVFTCILALMLVTLLKRKLHLAGIEMSSKEILQELGEVRQVIFTTRRRKKHLKRLERMNGNQRKIHGILDLGRYE